MKTICRMGERSLFADNTNTQILRVTWEIR